MLAAREAGRPIGGYLVMVEHDPVITVSRRPTAAGNVIAPPEMLQRQGVAVEETDRGGDVTYHGPGQQVVYPILDLNYFNLRLHDYMRLLEGAVIAACRGWGVEAHRDACATGVWVGGVERAAGEACNGPEGGRKICAMGVRVRKWVSLHGLALNVTTNLEHFGLIVPCGLVGRPVTSLQRELDQRCPGMHEVKRRLSEELSARLGERVTSAG